MYLNGLNNFPAEKAYGIIQMKGVYIPGDERSRTAPGHGYPERTEYYPELQIFLAEDEWKAEIKKLMFSEHGRKDFRAFVIEPVKVDANIDVVVS